MTEHLFFHARQAPPDRTPQTHLALSYGGSRQAVDPLPRGNRSDQRHAHRRGGAYSRGFLIGSKLGNNLLCSASAKKRASERCKRSHTDFEVDPGVEEEPGLEGTAVRPSGGLLSRFPLQLEDPRQGAKAFATSRLFDQLSGWLEVEVTDKMVKAGGTLELPHLIRPLLWGSAATRGLPR